MQSWKPDIAGSPGPKYMAIAEALLLDIQAGRLSPGTRLPPQRALAASLSVDLTTITRAYGEAQRRGMIESNGRRGSFVRERQNPDARTTRVDTGDAGMNAPPELPDGLLSREFRRSAEALLGGSGPLAQQYQPRGGMPAAREAGGRLLAARGIACFDDSVLVTAGGQHALHAVFSAELVVGDVLAVTQFVYPGLLALARRFGISLRVVPSDGEGIDADALEQLCSAEHIRGLYVVPTNDNPTTVTISLERRKALAQVAERHGLLVIEDDAYGLLAENSLPSIAALAPDQTWHIASVSKALSPGLRVAWLRAPGIAQAWRLAADIHETAIMAPPLNTAIVSDWIDTGVFDRIVGEVRTEAHARMKIARRMLLSTAFMAHDDGYHLWVPLGEGADMEQIGAVLRPHGLSCISSHAFASEPQAAPAALRVSIGGTISRDQLERGLRLLGALIDPHDTRKAALI